MKTDPNTRFLMEARNCAMQMMENGAYIEKELPSLRMPDALRQSLQGLCENLISTKHDVMHEIFEADDLLKRAPDSGLSDSNFRNIRNWINSSVAEMNQCVEATQRAIREGQADPLLFILVAETATNVLKSVPSTHGADNCDAIRVQAPKTLNEKLDEMGPDERFEFWRKAEEDATDPENKAEIREAWMIDCHSRFMESLFKDEIVSVDNDPKPAPEEEIFTDFDDETDEDEDSYDPNCFAFQSEDSYPVGKLISAIRGLVNRPDLPAETTESLKVFLFAMQRLPLVTPGVRMSLGLRLDQGGESDWIEIRMEDGEFSLGRGSWIDGDADTETVFEVTPDYREGDAFIATGFAESFTECARDVCREVVIDDTSDEPFTDWDLLPDKSRWSSLPCSFL